MGHEQTVLIVMLKIFSRTNRYLAINQKGKLKITKVRSVVIIIIIGAIPAFNRAWSQLVVLHERVQRGLAISILP